MRIMVIWPILLLFPLIVATLVVLLIKFPKPALITLAVLVIVAPLFAITVAIGLPALTKGSHRVYVQPVAPVQVTPPLAPLVPVRPPEQPVVQQWVDEVNQQAALQQVAASQPAVDRTWVTDTAAFINASPHRRFLIARSTPTSINETEAIAQARRNAVALISSQLGGLDQQQTGYLRHSMDHLIVDQVVERHEKPYGEVWSAALLLDISPEKLAPFATTMNQQQMRKDQSARWTLVASGALFAVMWLLYLGLNTITRGYYAWRLRAIGIVCGIGLIMLVMLRLKMMT